MCCGLLLVQCFAVPERACEDDSGLFVASQLCMPPAGFDLTVPRLVVDLIPADFDGEGLYNDLAGLMYEGELADLDASALIVAMRTDLSEPARTLVDLPTRTTGLTPVSVGSNRQDLVYVYDPSEAEDVGFLGYLANSEGFAGAPIEHPLRGNVPFLGEYGCRLPVGVTTADKNSFVLVSCALNTDKHDATDMLEYRGADVATIDMPKFLSPAPNDYYAAAHEASVLAAHASVVFDVNGDGLLDGATASKPVEADGAERVAADDHKIVVVAFPMGMLPMIMSSYVDAGPIEGLYAADLDGDGVSELVTRHLDGGQLSILRQKGEGSLEFEVAQELEVRQPIDVAIGDFTGDGGIDLAVVHADRNDHTTAAVFIRAPDQGAGGFEYGFTDMGGVKDDEAATAIAALDVDEDEALDLAVAVAAATGTEVRVFLNRSTRVE